jgi:4-hydroxy-tetrahydrodipicolinate synthase
VAPRLVADLVAASLAGDRSRASALQLKLNPLHRALFIESNPIPLKAALAMMGRFADELRLPLTPMSDMHRSKLRAALQELELL